MAFKENPPRKRNRGDATEPVHFGGRGKLKEKGRKKKKKKKGGRGKWTED